MNHYQCNLVSNSIGCGWRISLGNWDSWDSLERCWRKYGHVTATHKTFRCKAHKKYFRKLPNRLTQRLEKPVYVGGLPREYCQCLTQQAPLYWKKTASHPTLQCFPSFVQEFSVGKSVKAVPHHCVCRGIIISSPLSPVGRLIPFKCWNRSQDPTNNSPGRLFTSQVPQPTC